MNRASVLLFVILQSVALCTLSSWAQESDLQKLSVAGLDALNRGKIGEEARKLLFVLVYDTA